MIGEITAAASEQSQGIGDVSVAVTESDPMTQQNAALVEESAAAAETLREPALRLTAVVGSFRLQAQAQDLAGTAAESALFRERPARLRA